MNHELEHIMNEALDGEASPEDRERLEKALARDPELRERYAELQSLFESLAAVQMVDAPEGLSGEIERSLADEADDVAPRTVRAPEPESHGPWYAPMLAAFTRRPAPAFAATFASGTALGAVIAIAFGGAMWNGADDPRIAGQMGGPAAEVLAIDTGELSIGTTDVVVETIRDGRGVEGRIRASSEVPVEIEVEFDPAAPLVGLHWTHPGSRDMRHEAGHLWFRHEGDAEYTLSFADQASAATPLKITLRSQDQTVEEVVATDPGGE